MKITTAQRVEQAAFNNALWCDTVCATHGCPGEFREGAWINLRRTPRFYPNVVTLGGAGLASAHQERVAEVIRVGLPEGGAIKDSFETLRLEAIGGRILFDAHWLYRPATSPPPVVAIPGVQWGTVADTPTLEAWEVAWNGGPEALGLFLPALLGNRDVAFIAAWREDKIIAGAITNRAAECVGVSNVFVPDTEAQEFRGGCVVGALSAFPGLPLVGYESGPEVGQMLAWGFEVVGALRVWQFRGPTEAQGAAPGVWTEP